MAPMIPPQMTGSARRTGCAVRAPELDTNSLHVNAGNGVEAGILHQVADDIHNALMMTKWGAAQGDAAQRKLWQNGPYGQDELSMQTFFGAYSPLALRQLEAELAGMLSAFMGSQPLTVQLGPEAVFDTQKNFMTISKDTSLGQILAMLAGAVGIRNQAAIAKFIRQRGIAAENCIVSDAQR